MKNRILTSPSVTTAHTPKETLLSTASGHFIYSQTAHTDLNGSVWDAPTEGTQDFHGDEDFHFTYGQITPRGQDQNEALDDMTSKWITHRAGDACPGAYETSQLSKLVEEFQTQDCPRPPHIRAALGYSLLSPKDSTCLILT